MELLLIQSRSSEWKYGIQRIIQCLLNCSRRILAILHMNSATEPSQWEVRTDRGETRFVVRQDEDVRRLDNHRALVIDAHGIRYLIEDTRELDAHSRRLLERYL